MNAKFPDPSEMLNRDCRCISIDREALDRALQAAIGDTGLYETIRESRPHLFASTAVFVSRRHVERMGAIVRAVEAVAALPGYRERVLAWAPDIARFDPGTRGVFLGYDFHLGPEGPQLIEINTNAGGALLNGLLARAQRACCKEMEGMAPASAEPGATEKDFLDMFLAEWRYVRGEGAPRTIALVDDAPSEQYLYPEFLLFRTLFRRHGIEAVIADPAELAWRDKRLWYRDTVIDLVYNRLTDFPLAHESHAAVRAAYLDGGAVVTPHPRAHALYADKRNLTLLTDESFLRSLALPPATLATLLGGIPRTVTVTPERGEELWNTRRQWFFKPAAGYGSRAAYRGDKLTRRVWREILAGAYVAQAKVEPAVRSLRLDEDAVSLKFDIRLYVYAGRVQRVAARLYQGQTTNFRTRGGGFAPVFCPPAALETCHEAPAAGCRPG
jgi:hypothetical protein